MPGLLLCFVMRYDRHKKQAAAAAADTEQSKITYFHCSLIGYIVGEFHQVLYSDVGSLWIKTLKNVTKIAVNVWENLKVQCPVS